MTPAELCRMAAERIHERSARSTVQAMLWPYPESCGLDDALLPPQGAWKTAIRLRDALFPEIDDAPARHRSARILALLLLGEILEEENGHN